MCKDIWEQTPAHRNYERYSYLCSILGKDPKTYKPLIDAKERLRKESEPAPEMFIIK